MTVIFKPTMLLCSLFPAGSIMLMTMVASQNENDGGVLLCHETLDGIDTVKGSKKPRALQSIQSNNNNKTTTVPSKKKKPSKKKRKAAKHSLTTLEDTIKSQQLCTCGKIMAAKCANRQCADCCNGCPRHKAAAKKKASKKQSIVVKNVDVTTKEDSKSNTKESVVESKTVEPKEKVEPVEPKEEEKVAPSEVSVETVDLQQEDDLEVVPIDIGKGHNDLIGSLIRAIASFPNFCPE